jgi:hypothetical protein
VSGSNKRLEQHHSKSIEIYIIRVSAGFEIGEGILIQSELLVEQVLLQVRYYAFFTPREKCSGSDAEYPAGWLNTLGMSF